MSRTVTLPGGTITLTDGGDWQCSTRDLQIAVAQRLEALPSDEAVFEYFIELAAQPERTPSPNGYTARDRTRPVRNLPTVSRAEALRQLRGINDATLARNPRVALA